MRKPGDKLKDLDVIVSDFPNFFSLNPQRLKAQSPSILGTNFEGKNFSEEKIFFLEDQLYDLFISQQENFSKNIFWDFEALLSKLLSLNSMKEQRRLTQKILKLHVRYGSQSSINFAYVHDFVYGFDWYRWVKKDLSRRANIRPYDFVFLDYLDNRSLELYELIIKNDKKYPLLESGSKRNPFIFKRSIPEEIKLHLKLAECDAVPWKAWQESPLVSESLWQRDLIGERNKFGAFK